MLRRLSDTNKVLEKLRYWETPLSEAADSDTAQDSESETYQAVWQAFWDREDFGPDYDPDADMDPQAELHAYLDGIDMGMVIDRYSTTYTKQVAVDDVGLFDKATHRRLD